MRKYGIRYLQYSQYSQYSHVPLLCIVTAIYPRGYIGTYSTHSTHSTHSTLINHSTHSTHGAEQYSSSVSYRQGGTNLVDGASQVMESLQSAATSQLGKDNYRCIQLELGSSLQGDDPMGEPWSQTEAFYHIITWKC